MLGMVYTELMEMVETTFSMDTVDAIIERSGVSGAYTAVGNYSDAELFALVDALSTETQIPVPDLLTAYGEYLFDTFVREFPHFFDAHSEATSFLAGLESHVHAEVRKLYPGANPPLFSLAKNEHDESYVLEYQSRRGLFTFAQALLEKCLLHYNSKLTISECNDLSDGAGTHVRFILVKR